ncbi:hypothetical protein [Bizionia argentinensis]|nr:hypothetical protein [Bizionia argentinensis]
MEATMYLLIAIVVIFLLLIAGLSAMIFNDTDADMFWYDAQQNPNKNKND